MNNNLFANIYIIGFDGQSYSHRPPSTIPKPFKSVRIRCENGKVIEPLDRRAYWDGNKPCIGYDVSIKVITSLTATGKSIYFYRIIYIFPDGAKWSTLFNLEGNLVGEEWC